MKIRLYFIALFLLIFFVDYYTKHLYYNVNLNTRYDDYLKTYVSEDFKNYKIFKYADYINKEIKQFSIKIDLDKNEFKKNTRYLTIISDPSSLSFSNALYTKDKNMIIIKLDKNTNESLVFNYKYKSVKKGEFRFNIISSFEHDYLLPFEEILYGLAYGIIFSAFLYYLIIYFSTFSLYFLYYSLMQLFVCLVLLGFTYFSFKPYPDAFGSGIVDLFETTAFAFTLLFAKEVLHTKKTMPSMNLFLNFFILLNILDIFTIIFLKSSFLYNYLPFFMIFLIASFAGLLAVYKGNKSAKFYTLGWLLMMVLVFITERGLFPISGIYAIHIIAPLESLIFTFALAYMLKEIVKEKNEKEKLLIHKSKLASMGEMINNIAHQWRQPLMHLSYINMNLQLSSEDDDLDKKYLNDKMIESNTQLEFMSKTIDNFRDFYKPTKEKEIFLISSAVQKAIDIMSPILRENKISLKLEIQEDKEINSYENEYSQVVLNLITNAKDALVLKETKSANITIKVLSSNNKSLTVVLDNAGGVPIKNIDKIFEPYFTTKHTGSGIGLYMSKTIIESHFKGSLELENKEFGACFSIKV